MGDKRWRSQVCWLAAAEISRLEEAKPILDLLAGMRDHAPDPDPALIAAGWHLVPVELDGQPWRRFYVLPKNGRRYAHLHLVVPSAERFQLLLAFRDQLRADPETTRAYAALKRELSERHRNDLEAYTRAKASFIEGVLAQLPPSMGR